MTQEYEFFKDFAGVTDADLEMFKCGGKSSKKVKKMEPGGNVNKKKQAAPNVVTKTEHNWDEGQTANIHKYPGTKQPADTIVRNDGKNPSYYRYANGKTKPASKVDFEKGRKGKQK